MTPSQPSENVSPKEFGELVGLVKAIHENTQTLPDLCKTVERHDTQLKGILWTVGIACTAAIGAVFTWIRAHFQR